MNERSRDLENYHELKFSREKSFFDKSLAISVAIGIVFAVALFLILHFRETRVEVLELNTLAPGYVVAQTDFDFFDEESTAIMKQEAIRDLGKIYKLQNSEIEERRIEFENFLIYHQEWRKYVESSTFEQMYDGASNIEKVMMNLHFTDLRTLQKIKEIGLSTDLYTIYTPNELNEKTAIPQTVWRYIADKALPHLQFPEPNRSFILGFFQNFLWTIEEDTKLERTLQKKIQEKIPDKYTHIKAGNRIIDQGERVTARHVAMMQAMKTALRENRNLWHPITIIGSLLLSLLFTAICIIYFKSNFPQILYSNRKLSLIVTVILLTMLIAKATEYFLLSQSSAIEIVRYPVFIAFAAIILCSLMNAGIATFATGFLTLIFTISLSFERQGFMIINVLAALVAILSAHTLRRRKEIFIVCAKAWIACIIGIFALHFSNGEYWNVKIFTDILTTATFMLLTAIAVVGLLPLLESIFKVMTDVSLTEYMDPNNDLLRRLTIEAPGTYQHSIVVGNIAESAAVAIGANGLFCRVATLYHDIGKMATPQYFTENQQGGMNIHQLLTPQESAAVIIAHVSEGVAMAKKAGLPEPFIDIIKEHHGTSLVYYFYRKQLDKVGDILQVNEAEFRYAGPKPRSKESAIIMLSDTIEAASRSLDKVDEKSLSELAERLVSEKIEDGQFDNCLLTLEELHIVVQTLVKTLVAFAHSRVKYPSREVKNHIFAPSYEA